MKPIDRVRAGVTFCGALLTVLTVADAYARPITAMISSADMYALSGDADGPALGLRELNAGVAPPRGHRYYQLQGTSNYCLTETVRDLKTLSPTLWPFLNELRALSYAGNFAESMCWILVHPDDSAEAECIRGSAYGSISGREMDPPFQRVLARFGSGPIKRVVHIHTHPSAQIYTAMTGEPLNHMGPSEPDLQYHVTMDDEFARTRGLPLGAYLSIVFPLDGASGYDTYYTTHSFDPPGHTCPPQPGPDHL